MGQVRSACCVLSVAVLAAAGCRAPHAVGPQAPPLPSLSAALAPPSTPSAALAQHLPVPPAPQPDGPPLPINLPTALQLANVRAVDVAAAAERIQVAAAMLEHARALWLPSVTVGGDYYYHSGPIQDVSNAIFDDRHSSVLLGAGSGIGPAAVLTVADAIFTPLVARQQVQAREADSQAASNDTLVAVTDAYFTVQQARGELAGALEATRHTEELVRRANKLAPAIVPDLELFRAETELARRRQSEYLARERWTVASAELLRVLRLDPTAQVQPVEPPQLRVELIGLDKPVQELIPIGLTYRPELAAQQAQIQATLASVNQERWRPLLPNILLRGASTNPAGTLGAGAFWPSPSFGIAGMRGDLDLQVLWQLDNLGLGNRALIHQREAENRLAVVELARIRYRVAAEIAQAYAQAQQATQRATAAERGLRSAVLSVEKNLSALNEAKMVGNQLVTLVRPQEVVAAIQALGQAYSDYYGSIADANRAQFRLYRALGQPAQHLARQAAVPQTCAAGAAAPVVPVERPVAPPPPTDPTFRAGKLGPPH